MSITATQSNAAYQALMRDCRNLKASPERIHAQFQRVIQQVAESSFSQGYDQGIAGQEVAARAAFMAGFEKGRSLV